MGLICEELCTSFQGSRLALVSKALVRDGHGERLNFINGKTAIIVLVNQEVKFYSPCTTVYYETTIELEFGVAMQWHKNNGRSLGQLR